MADNTQLLTWGSPRAVQRSQLNLHEDHYQIVLLAMCNPLDDGARGLDASSSRWVAAVWLRTGKLSVGLWADVLPSP
jgi:hypothetical protein